MKKLNDRERHLLARSLFRFNVFLSDEFHKAQEKIAFKERLYQDAKADYEKHYDLQEDIKVIMALRSECLSHLKHII